MRLSIATTVLVTAVVLAGCATPLHQDATPAATPTPATAPAAASPAPLPAPSPPQVVLPPLIEMTPFKPAEAAALEELPVAREDLWDRIRARFQLPEIEGPEVTKWEQWYAARPDYVARMIDRSRRFLYYVVVEVEQRDMPAEIALLPMIESAYNPNAMSTSRASGIWQFIPSTGSMYGLKQNFWFDSRRDVVAATASALSYLDKLHTRFGDWQLALAAYNWGEGNVGRAIERNQRAARPTDYASLRAPDETRNYLPKLQAMKNIVLDPEKYGLSLADIPDAPYFAVVKTTKEIDVKRAAELAEMPLDEFQYLNPHHNRPVIAGADEYTLLLPIDKAELFAAKLDLIDQPLVSWQAYRMRPGDTLVQVAARFGMPIQTLRAVNGIGVRSTVPPGYAVLVPAQLSSRESAKSLIHAVFTTVPQGRTFYYRVHRGDTLTRVAARYDVTPEEIRRWNGLGQSKLAVGQHLRITSDHAPRAAQGKRAGGKALKPARSRIRSTRGAARDAAAARPTSGGRGTAVKPARAHARRSPAQPVRQSATTRRPRHRALARR